MSPEVEERLEYERMRGEYLSLFASLEFNLTFLLSEFLDVQSHPDEFRKWFASAPLPFNSKVSLFEMLTRESIMLSQFGDLGAELRDSNGFRNILAHSFRWSNSTMTARDKEVPEEQVAFPVVREKLERLRHLENLIVNMLANKIQGPIQPFSADDFADWPI